MRMQVLKNLSWVGLFAGPIIAAGSPEHPRLVIFALTFAVSAAVTLAWLNGSMTRRTIGEPLSHVRPASGFHIESLVPPEPVDQIPAPPPPAPRLTTVVEDALHIASFNEYRRRLDTNLDDIGRTLKVGVDVHSSLCWDGHRLTCVCGMPDAGEVSA